MWEALITMSDRIGKCERTTNETEISLVINLDGKGKVALSSPINFFTHMLNTLAKHSLIDISGKIDGDIEVDQHHTMEDTGFVLGRAFEEALGTKRGIKRCGFFGFPMDDAFVITAIDFCGRSYFQFDAIFKRRYVGDLDTDLIAIFFEAFTRGANCNLRIEMRSGQNDHHIVECIFKSIAKSIRSACEIDPRQGDDIPSTKGVI